MPILSQRTVIARLAWMVSVLILAACTRNAISPLSREESAAVKRGSSAIVLLRFTVEDQKGDRGDPFRVLEIVPNNLDGTYRLAVGDFDSGGKPKFRDFHILSAEARHEGWLTRTLSPGYYYFVMGPTIIGNIAASWYLEAAPRWRIEVPPGAAVIYAGTFHLYVTKGVKLIELAFGTLDQEATKIEDETASAAQTARRDLSTLPPPVTRLAVRHTGPILLDMPPPLPSSN